MTLPEQETPEGITSDERIEERLRGLAYFGSGKLLKPDGGSSRFHILIRDEVTREKVAIFVSSRHTKDHGREISFGSARALPSEETVLEAVDILLKTDPKTPMVCDMSILDELRGDSLRLVEDGHFQFTGNSRGTLEIHTPPVSVNVS